jgi:transposase InsO family protein
VWEVPRASLYFRRKLRPAPQRRGPKPLIPDIQLLEDIREDLATSPFTGEGHRKVYYRLKHERHVKVAMKRVLRLMRENNLLSPHRVAKGDPKAHDGTIGTDRPLEMWGTDGTMVQTVEEGTVWVFSAVEHFNGECVGIHASKSGDRFHAMEPVRHGARSPWSPFAMEPVRQGVRRHFGPVAKGVVSGLALRTDHGSQYVSDWFQKECKFLGIRQSLAYVREPQTNGVVERFWKTLKEQIIEGRIYHTIQDLQAALTAFMELYNSLWRMEKLGGRTPIEARDAWQAAKTAA